MILNVFENFLNMLADDSNTVMVMIAALKEMGIVVSRASHSSWALASNTNSPCFFREKVSPTVPTGLANKHMYQLGEGWRQKNPQNAKEASISTLTLIL